MRAPCRDLLGVRGASQHAVTGSASGIGAAYLHGAGLAVDGGITSTR